MVRFAAVSGVLALLVATAASAHDFESRRSGESEVVAAFERVLEAEPAISKSRAQLYSHIATELIWPEGQRKIPVCYWDTDEPGWMADVETYANEVAKGLPVTFVWKTNGAYNVCSKATKSKYPVRVSLKPVMARLAPGDNPEAYFAVIGSWGRTDKRLATVNLPFSGASTKEEFQSKVKHEFCHVLGCLHEHQRDLCEPFFDGPKIQQLRGLTAEQYAAQYLGVTDQSMGAKAFGQFDDESIMMYEFKAELFKGTPPKACISAGAATRLSDLDEAGLAEVYKKKAGQTLTYAAFVGRADVLRDQALQARLEAAQARNDRPQLKGLGYLNVFALIESESLKARAKSQAAEAERLEAEAETFTLQQETVARLKEAMALADRVRASEDTEQRP